MMTAEDINKRRMEDLDAAVAAYGALGRIGKPSIAIYMNKDGEGIYAAQRLMRSFHAWNDFHPAAVASTIGIICDMLPKCEYGENNQNNGNPRFDTIKITGDTKIELFCTTVSKFTESEFKCVQNIVETYGERMHADECNLYVEENKLKNGQTFSWSYHIRFWWD